MEYILRQHQKWCRVESRSFALFVCHAANWTAGLAGALDGASAVDVTHRSDDDVRNEQDLYLQFIDFPSACLSLSMPFWWAELNPFHVYDWAELWLCIDTIVYFRCGECVRTRSFGLLANLYSFLLLVARVIWYWKFILLVCWLAREFVWSSDKKVLMFLCSKMVKAHAQRTLSAACTNEWPNILTGPISVCLSVYWQQTGQWIDSVCFHSQHSLSLWPTKYLQGFCSFN